MMSGIRKTSIAPRARMKNSIYRILTKNISKIDMAKFKYFELAEFIKSETATKKKIDNTPTFEIVDHLSELVSSILDPLRGAYGKPVHVSSGYRCKKLNEAVGGVNTSAHQRGDAADLQAANMADFKAFVKEWLVRNRIRFDQCLLETSGKAEWVHISIYSANGSQRGRSN